MRPRLQPYVHLYTYTAEEQGLVEGFMKVYCITILSKQLTLQTQ